MKLETKLDVCGLLKAKPYSAIAITAIKHPPMKNKPNAGSAIRLKELIDIGGKNEYTEFRGSLL